MAHVMVRLTVKDQAVWKKTFEEAGSLRKKFGSMGVQAYAKADNPNEITIIGEYESLDKARELFQSQEFKDATQRAGMVGAPEVSFLTEVVKLNA